MVAIDQNHRVCPLFEVVNAVAVVLGFADEQYKFVWQGDDWVMLYLRLTLKILVPVFTADTCCNASNYDSTHEGQTDCQVKWR